MWLPSSAFNLTLKFWVTHLSETIVPICKITVSEPLRLNHHENLKSYKYMCLVLYEGSLLSVPLNTVCPVTVFDATYPCRRNFLWDYAWLICLIAVQGLSSRHLNLEVLYHNPTPVSSKGAFLLTLGLVIRCIMYPGLFFSSPVLSCVEKKSYQFFCFFFEVPLTRSYHYAVSLLFL